MMGYTDFAAYFIGKGSNLYSIFLLFKLTPYVIFKRDFY